MSDKSKLSETEQGSRCRIKTKEGTVHEGIFISSGKDFIYLKLSSGYNIGISQGSIESFQILASPHKKASSSTEKTAEENTEIMILHTGGTIASKVDYTTGAVNSKFTPDEMIALFPELKNIASIDSRLVRNMWSEDMRPAHYNVLAKEIEKALTIKSLRGIILTHGTDTMHYTASALSFVFESLSVPVVLVGSQRSSDRPSSDAALNLLSAAFFISKAQEHNLTGVFICMHASTDDKYCSILPAQNARKMHSTRRDAFKSINCSPVAKINFERKEIEIVAGKHFTPKTEHCEPKFFNPEIKVGILRSRPGLLAEELKIYEKFDGLILEGTGLGLMPISHIDDETVQNGEIFSELKKLSGKIVVAITTQTIYGRVNMNVYSPGRSLRSLGILGHNLDMTTETAYIKLCWLLSNYSAEEARKLYGENLRGEISPRSEKEEFL